MDIYMWPPIRAWLQMDVLNASAYLHLLVPKKYFWRQQERKESQNNLRKMSQIARGKKHACNLISPIRWHAKNLDGS